MLVLKKIKRFTLAEVLITLGIIGVVAALTIPTLINNYQEKATVTKLKKFYSIMNQAVALAKIENGDIDGWTTNAAQSLAAADDYVKILEKGLKFTKKCYSEANGGCIPSENIYLNGSSGGNPDEYTNSSKMILADGSSFRLYVHSPSCSASEDGLNNTCAFVLY